MTERWPKANELGDDDPIAALEKDHVDSILERLHAHRAPTSRHVEGQVLGQGGMGIVLEVRDADLKRPLALKRLHPKRAEQADGDLGRHYLARFLQEAQVTGQLAHPGIPPVHELSVDENGPFFTMPVIRGQNLDEVFAKARTGADGWSIARALGVLLKVCEAMSFAHAKRVVHRDLKPDNVRIGRFGEVYVMDWGLARVIGRDEIDLVRWSKTGPLSSVHTDRGDSDGDANAVLQTLDGDVLGTPYYMPPEQARGELERVGPRTDVYAVGGMLYLLLTGRAPYQPAEGRISPRTVLAAVLHGPPPTVASIAPTADPDLVAVCEKAMSREIDGRYATMEELASDLQAWIDRRPIRASAPSVRHALRLFAERHKPAVVTAVAGLIMLLSAAVIFTWRVTRERDDKELARVEAQRRGDAMAASALEAQAAELWPALPRMLEAMQRWLDNADALLVRSSEYEDALSNPQLPERERAEIVDLLARGKHIPKFRAEIVSRVDCARTIATLSEFEARADWEAAQEQIRGDPRYNGFELRPQLGLSPLWIDEMTGYFEFWHIASGDKPTRKGPRPQDGITLVLIPGPPDTWAPTLKSTDSTGQANPTTPVLPVLASKYEVTQAQWERTMGTNPSLFRYPSSDLDLDYPLRPVESISQLDAAQFAKRLDLVLPDERTWVWLALGGSSKKFAIGDTVESLEGYANIRGKSAQAAAGQTQASWDDGFSIPAPIGSFKPNGFGIHDILGNIAEWTSTSEMRPLDDSPAGRTQARGSRKVYRGGSFYFGPEMSAPLIRSADHERGFNQARGMRPIKTLPEGT